MKTPLFLMLLFVGFQAIAQVKADSSTLEEVPEQEMVDTVTYYEEEYEYDSVYIYNQAQYTQKPGELSVTKDEQQKNYSSKKFSKTEWKRIVGGTNYAEESQEVTPPNIRPPVWDPFIIKVIGYVLIFALITVVIVLFARQALKSSGNKKRKQQGVLFLDETQPEDVEDIDLEKLLQGALAQNNLRLAVRLYYIKLLKHLNREGYIRREKNKTNRDYAGELSTFGFSREFRQLMVAYEYVWYGERTPSPEEFNVLESNFKNLFKAQRA